MGITLKELRDKTGLSQKQFAEKFEIPLSTLRKWEQGESRPAPYVLKMLAEKIPVNTDSVRKIEDRDGAEYYYDPLSGMLTDAAGTQIRINTDLTGVKEENLPLYVKDLFESYYDVLDKFDRECRYDKTSDIIWS